MRIFLAMAVAALVCGWFAPASSAQTRVRHHARHPYARVSPYDRPSAALPPGYNMGGPNYTACDRINHDRMLVGTCR